MSQKQKIVLTFLSLTVIGVLIGIVLLLSSGAISLKSNSDSEPVWHPRTLSEIYDPFGEIETDLNNYIWPTDITNIMTSAFGEFRSTHFHAGIDISTRGQIGAPVFASRNGSVEQIGVSPFGYGKYILMRHEDGYATLYAHLDGFDEPIDERVYEHQCKTGTYSVTMNFEPGEFVYKQGEIIARSGSTGSGPPHIHFEIRDTNNNPINPKLAAHININDTLPPIFNRLAAIPVHIQGFVNDRLTPITVAAVAVRRGEYVIENPIKASGKIGMAVDVHDRNNDTWYRHGIYAIKFFLEDSLFHSLQYDRLPIAYRHQVRMHYDHHLLSTGRGRYRKLFIEEGNALPLYARRGHGSGLINTDDFTPGSYDFSIIAYDIAGNTSTLSGKLVIETAPPRNNPGNKSPDIGNTPQRPFSESSLQIKTEIFRDMLLVTITHPEFVETPSPLLVQNEKDIQTIHRNHRIGFTRQYRVQLLPSSESTLHFKYLYKDTVYTHSETVYSIRPEKSGEIILDRGNVIVSYDYGSVYYPLYFTVSRVEEEDEYYYSFNSTSSVLDKGIRYSIKVPDTLDPFARSIVYTRSSARWNTHGSTRDYENRTLTGYSRRIFNDIKTAVDTTAPSVSDVIVDGNRNMRLRFRMTDDESGIDHASLKIKLNGEIIIGRYDPDLSMVIYRTRSPLAPGTYNLSITVNDRAGNSTDYNRTVTIR